MSLINKIGICIGNVGLGAIPQDMTRNFEWYNPSLGTKLESGLELAGVLIYASFDPEYENYCFAYATVNALRLALSGGRILFDRIRYFGNPVLEAIYYGLKINREICDI